MDFGRNNSSLAIANPAAGHSPHIDEKASDWGGVEADILYYLRTYALTNQPKYEASAKITEFLWQVKFGPSQTIAKSP